MANLDEARNAILEALPVETSHSGESPSAEHLYVPPQHSKALRLERPLVVGTRGVGKTFWVSALQDEGLRKLLGSAIPQLDRTTIHTGFSERHAREHPDQATFERLIKDGHRPYNVWRTVFVRWAFNFLDEAFPWNSWQEGVTWVTDNPESVADRMLSASERLKDTRRHALILFDALDRLSGSWELMDDIVRGLLQAALWIRGYTNLSVKIFLREDQLERTVTDFPDASKLLATKAELSWALHDLHGLLWQHLVNAPGESGKILRDIYTKTVGASPIQEQGYFRPSDELKRETAAQRALFEALAGPWMGRDRRRGVPYVWTVSHLADGYGRTSPRSFLAAIRQAAEDTLERYPGHTQVLHYESIKRGVQKASEVRVNELAEDYPWLRKVLEPLEGLTVPVSFKEIQKKWEENKLDLPTIDESNQLPPQRLDEGWPGIKEDLMRLGVFEERSDGRIDMPDLYRVGFGLGRRGGVKPKR